MGNVTPEFGIWTPDEQDFIEPDVSLAAMAASIESGMGARVQAQETLAAAFLNAQDPFTLTAGDPGHAQVPIPFRIGQAGLNFMEGNLTLSGGVLKVATTGIYTVSASLAAYMPGASSLSYLELTMFRNLDRHGQAYVYNADTTLPVNVAHSTGMFCNAGDTIWASGAQYYGDYTKPPTLNTNFSQFNTLSVVLVQAIR